MEPVQYLDANSAHIAGVGDGPIIRLVPQPGCCPDCALLVNIHGGDAVPLRPCVHLVHRVKQIQAEVQKRS